VSRPNLARVDERMLQRMVQSMVSRGTIESVEDATAMQLLNIALHDGHSPTQVEHWQPYGFSYFPRVGSEVIALAVGGNRDLLVTMPGADPRYRLTGMQGGELAVHDDQGQRVHFKRDSVWVETTKKVVTKAPLVLVGEDNPGMPRVMTEAGPSSVMRAKVG